MVAAPFKLCFKSFDGEEKLCVEENLASLKVDGERETERINEPKFILPQAPRGGLKILCVTCKVLFVVVWCTVVVVVVVVVVVFVGSWNVVVCTVEVCTTIKPVAQSRTQSQSVYAASSVLYLAERLQRGSYAKENKENKTQLVDNCSWYWMVEMVTNKHNKQTNKQTRQKKQQNNQP